MKEDKIFISINTEDFIIHLKSDENREEGEVYPINKYHKNEDKIEYGYQSDKDGSHLDSTKGATCWFHFSFCARGVWEGRIYFKEEEFWSEDLKTINMLWDKIEIILKDRIKERNPGINFEFY